MISVWYDHFNYIKKHFFITVKLNTLFQEELASIIAAKKSVKDQIQSLETRGRDKQIISVRPEDRFQRNRQINHGERFQQEAEKER